MILPRPSPLRVSALLAAALALTLAPGTFAQPCPQTCIEVFTYKGCSTNPTGFWSGQTSMDGTTTVKYDLTAGTALAKTQYGGIGTVYAVDDYVITGPPDGTPVEITVRLALSSELVSDAAYFEGQATGGPDAGSRAAIADSASSSFRQFDNKQERLPRTLDLPLTKNAGQPFRLHWSVMAYSNWDLYVRVRAGISATLLFEVPPGVSISSCYGYVGNVVPARPASWGALKLRYR